MAEEPPRSPRTPRIYKEIKMTDDAITPGALGFAAWATAVVTPADEPAPVSGPELDVEDED